MAICQVLFLAAFFAVATAAEVKTDYPAPPPAYSKEQVYVSIHPTDDTFTNKIDRTEFKTIRI